MVNVGSPEWLYYAEAEGMTDLVDTREAKINGIIHELRERRKMRQDPQDYWYHTCEKFRIDPASLTFEEQERINREVFR